MAKARRTSKSVRPSPILVIGGGGHGVVVAEAASLAKLTVLGVLDDREECPAARTLKHMGSIFSGNRVSELLEKSAKLSFIVCLGDVGLRRRVLDALSADKRERGRNVIHPASFVSPSATLGTGVFVGPQAVVHSRADVQSHVIINSGAIIEHDCVVGENTHVAPGAILAGGSRTGKDVLVGVGSRVLPGIRIGDAAIIGAGAVVITDVEAGKTVKGIPAR